MGRYCGCMERNDRREPRGAVSEAARVFREAAGWVPTLARGIGAEAWAGPGLGVAEAGMGWAGAWGGRGGDGLGCLGLWPRWIKSFPQAWRRLSLRAQVCELRSARAEADVTLAV